jgi:hypothetical protein
MTALIVTNRERCHSHSASLDNSILGAAHPLLTVWTALNATAQAQALAFAACFEDSSP